jgi:hypothetical protein
MTRWTFRHLLVKRAYTREQLEELVRRSRFGRFELSMTGIGFDLRLHKETGTTAAAQASGAPDQGPTVAAT